MEGCKKIVIVGNSGAGKSTLSRDLSRRMAIPFYSIDKIYWLPGWKLRTQSSFHNLHEEWIKEESWIIDGIGYWEELEQRISGSDVVIFLDVPVEVCKQRAEMRIERERTAPNADITSGCEYGTVKEVQMDVIEHFHRELRPKLFKYLSGLSSEKVRIIGSPTELECLT